MGLKEVEDHCSNARFEAGVVASWRRHPIFIFLPVSVNKQAFGNKNKRAFSYKTIPLSPGAVAEKCLL